MHKTTQAKFVKLLLRQALKCNKINTILKYQLFAIFNWVY